MSVRIDAPYQDKKNKLPDDSIIIPGHVQIEVYKEINV